MRYTVKQNPDEVNIMTLEEILAKIESDELKEAIVDKLEQEKEKGKKSYKEKDVELLKYKDKYKRTLSELGYDPDKFSDIDTFIDSKKIIEKNVSESKLTIATLKSELDDFKAKLEQERMEAERVRTVSKQNKLTAELTNTIGSEFIGSKHLIKNLISDGRVDIDETTNKIFFKNGDDVITFEKGLEDLRIENKEMLKVSQRGGTGDTGGVGVKINDDLLSKPADDILNELGL